MPPDPEKALSVIPQAAGSTRQLLRVQLLGKFALWYGETAITLQTPSYQALLAYLLLHPDQLHSRQHLAFTFWPDSTDKQARTNLRKALYNLRHILPDPDLFLQVDAHQIGWCGTALCALDTVAFETAVASAKQTTSPAEQYQLLNQALALYTGDLLPDHYEEWIIVRRERLRQDYLACLAQLVQLAENGRDYEAASDFAQRLLQEDPLQEAACRSLMRLQALAGNRAGALRTYHTCATRLQRELGVLPSPATQEAHRRLLNLETVPVSPLPVRAPLVAREKSWATLQSWWQRATRQRPLLALLRGEAGIGKTRLAEELLEWAARQGITTLSAACYAAAGSLPYAPVADWLRAEVMHRPLTRLADKWLREVSRVLPELLAARPDLTPPGPITERWQQQHLLTALANAILSADQPLLLFIDSLQWCDPDTLAWLCFLLHFDAQARFMLLGAVRTGEIANDHPLTALCQDLRQDGRFVEIELGRLDAPATTTLAAHVTDRTLVAPQAARLFAETEGVPLFIVEMARAGEAEPVFSEPFSVLSGRSVAGEAADVVVALPAKVRGVIEARLANLSLAARELVGLAAAIGRFFTFDLLAAASEEPETKLVPALDELWQQRIIREQGVEGYDFSHDKLRQVAYASLSVAKRRWLHGRIINALETLHANNLDEVSGKLAAHCDAAGQMNQAVGYYQRAAEVAQAIYANQETIHYLQRAVALFPRSEVEVQQRVTIYEQLGDVLLTVGRYREAEEAFTTAINLITDTIHHARLLRKRGEMWIPQQKLDTATTNYDNALQMLGLEPTCDAYLWWQAWLDVQLCRGDIFYYKAQLPALAEHITQLQTPIANYGLAEQQCRFLNLQKKLIFHQKRFRLDAADVSLSQRILDLAKETGDEHLVTDSRFALGFARLFFGSVRDAIADLSAALHQAIDNGNIFLQDQCLAYLTLAHRARGDVAKVRLFVAQHSPVTVKVGNPAYYGILKGNEAWLGFQAGDLKLVEEHGRAALTIWGAMPYPFKWVALWPLLASAVAKGRLTEAIGYAAQMLHPSQQLFEEEVTAVLQQAISAWENNQADSARTHLEQALELAQTYHYL